MTSNGPDSTDSTLHPIKDGSSPIDLNERLGSAVSELYQLLESYAPPWYTEELHARAEAALLAAGRVSAPGSQPKRNPRGCRNLREWYRPASP